MLDSDLKVMTAEEQKNTTSYPYSIGASDAMTIKDCDLKATAVSYIGAVQRPAACV